MIEIALDIPCVNYYISFIDDLYDMILMGGVKRIHPPVGEPEFKNPEFCSFGIVTGILNNAFTKALCWHDHSYL